MRHVARVLEDADEKAWQLAIAKSAGRLLDAAGGLDELSYVAELLELTGQAGQEERCVVEAAHILHGAGAEMLPVQLRQWVGQEGTDARLQRVVMALRRSRRGTILGSEEASRLADLLQVNAEPLRVASAESLIPKGQWLEAASLCLESLRSPRLAALCVAELPDEQFWAHGLDLCALASSDPMYAGAALEALKKAKRRQQFAGLPVIPTELVRLDPDPLLDEAFPTEIRPPVQLSSPKPAQEQQQPKAAKETAPKANDEDEDDLASIAKKAWGNFFGDQ